MISKNKLTDEDFQNILVKLQDKYNVSDFEVDIVYLKYGKRLKVDEIMKMVYAEYYPNKKNLNRATLANVYCQHIKKPNVKMYIQDVLEEVKKEFNRKNTILSIGQRMEFLSKVISGEIKEPAQSKYGTIYQREADIKTKIQAVNILNDYDLKSKEMQTGSEIIIEVIGEPVDINAYKKNRDSNRPYINKVSSSVPIDECFKDVMEDAVQS